MLREVISNEWLIALFVLSLALITVVKFTYSIRFSDFLFILFNSNYIKIYNNERRLIDNFNLLLILNYISSLTIFIILTYNQFISPLEFNIILFLQIATSVFLFMFFRIFIEKILAWVFDIVPVINHYIVEKINYRNFLGLLLLPINILLVFSVQPNKFILKVIGILLALLCIIGFINIIKTNLKLVFRNSFYFILYLCALEIGPYIILYKVFNHI
jgi:hypothetical protein